MCGHVYLYRVTVSNELVKYRNDKQYAMRCVCGPVAWVPSMLQTEPFVWFHGLVAPMLVISNEDFSTGILVRVAWL